MGFEVDADVLRVGLAVQGVGVGVSGVTGDDKATPREFLAVERGGVRVFGGADAELEDGIVALLGGGAAPGHGGDRRIGEQIAEEIALVEGEFPAFLVGGPVGAKLQFDDI